jgi:Protein of unknown function (DUF2652)
VLTLDNASCAAPDHRAVGLEGGRNASESVVLTDKVDGALMQDSIEQAYFAFRKRLRSIKQASSCKCQACSRMQSLDVKFVVITANSSGKRCQVAKSRWPRCDFGPPPP